MVVISFFPPGVVYRGAPNHMRHRFFGGLGLRLVTSLGFFHGSRSITDSWLGNYEGGRHLSKRSDAGASLMQVNRMRCLLLQCIAGGKYTMSRPCHLPWNPHLWGEHWPLVLHVKELPCIIIIIIWRQVLTRMICLFITIVNTEQRPRLRLVLRTRHSYAGGSRQK